MAKTVRVSTKGLSDSLEEIARLGRDVDAAAASALQAGGEVLLDGMVRRVPKDTRNLERHLVIKGPMRDGNFIAVEVGLIGADANTARYGNAQEYGTSSMPAQSYVRATAEADKGKAAKAMRDRLAQELEP